MNPIEQQFFNDLEKKLWTAADKLRSSLDASVYKHVVLGLIFLKYVSDAFEERQNELRAQFQNPDHDYYMDPADYPDDYEADIAAELEVRDYYTEKNVFWVPFEARWQTLRDLAQLPPGSELPWQVPKRDSDGRYVRNAAGELEMVPDKMRIRKHEHVLTPGRYVGAEEQEEDGEVFANKMARLAKSPVTPEYIYCLLTSPSFEILIRGLVTGTSNSHQRVKPDQVANLPVVIPPPEALGAFRKSTAQSLSYIGKGVARMANLATLRDTLLPTLLSGELSVTDATAEAEA